MFGKSYTPYISIYYSIIFNKTYLGVVILQMYGSTYCIIFGSVYICTICTLSCSSDVRWAKDRMRQ